MCCNTNRQCCCNCGCSCGCSCGCNCGCGSNNDSGINTLPSFPDQPAWSGDLSGYPVYVSVPTFLWNGSNNGSSCGCG